jgi:hypothetical protein
VNIGLDFHDTISYAPEFFLKFIKEWSGDVYIVTGTPPSKLNEIVGDLSKIGLQKEDFKDILMGFEYDKKNMNLSHFKKMAKHKLNLLKDNNIKIYVDDNPFYVNYVKNHGIFVLQPILSEKYLKEFETADPFFTCNLQKMQFNYLDTLENEVMVRNKCNESCNKSCNKGGEDE